MAVAVYKCPNCGAALEFDAELTSLHCDYCQSNFTPEEALAGEVNMEPHDVREDSSAAAEFEGAVKAYHCPECGADILTDENTAATFCRFCGSPAIVETNLSGNYRPVKIIPFSITKEQAKEAFIKWCRKGKVTPRGFAAEQQMEKISGMYVPFWLYDCDVEGFASGIGTRVHTWRHGDTQYTNTKYFRIRRRAELHFQRVPADGSKSMDNTMMDYLEPYDYSQLKDFEMPYLSGFLAEKYDEDYRAVFPRIREKIDRYTYEQLRSTIREYHTVTMDGHKTIFRKNDAIYAMLPVWMLMYRYQGQNYLFAMNGQNGKVVGKPPLSKGRLAIRTAAAAVISFIVMLLGGGFFL